MHQPSLHHITCPERDGGSHRMAWWQWGNADAPHVVMCVHGLTRQGRDFDTLAQALLARSAPGSLRVICPDVAGRGQSDWLRHPADYQVPVYAADMLALLQHLRPTTLDWLGTSMGGLIGMVVAGQPGLPLPVPVRRLVLNDVGPAIEWTAIQRIGSYLGKTMRFASLEQAADALLAISAGFGPHTREQWLALTRPMLKVAHDAEGGWVLHYDPALARPFQAMTPEQSTQGEATLWQLYDQIRAETLLLRGAESDLLTAATAQAMTARGPRARLVTFAGVGHAPTLVAPDQVQVVADFLLAESSSPIA